MKQLFLVWIILFGSSIFGADFAKKLPIEVKQLADSFACFSDRDKMVIYAYGLAIRYRMEHIKEKKALEHANLDYWRMHSLMYDVESRCKLDNLSDVVEGILTPTLKLRKRLKRLRWVESGLSQSDGQGESSKRMRKYDKKLLDSIMANPPKWTFEPKNPYLQDHNLSRLKMLPPNTLPKTVMTSISQAAQRKAKAKNTLIRLHDLYEQIIRHYDQPQKRLKYVQEKAWVDACLKRYQVGARGFISGNFHRSLARTLAIHYSYYPVRSDFLPRELDQFCEHNITQKELSTYVLAKDIPTKLQPKEPKITFNKTKSLLKQFAKEGVKTKQFDTYFNLSLKMFEGGGKDLMGGLRLIRLKNCLESIDHNRTLLFLHTMTNEIKHGDNKEEFSNKILRPQIWWMTTIGMKIKQEGKTEELAHFFDCNATILKLKPSKKLSHAKPVHLNLNSRDFYKLLSQKDDILKYYAATFVNKPTPDMTNAQAIQGGLIAPKWLDKNGTAIKSIGGIRVEIAGMPEGGVKLTYKNIPKGRTCKDMVRLSFANSISYDHKTYDGLDYALIDGHKVKTGRHFNGKYAWRLCDAQETHTISYVREKTITKHKYAATPVDSTCDQYSKNMTIDTLDSNPYGVAVTRNKKYFALSGTRYGSGSGLYDASISSKIFKFPDPMNNAFNLCVREDGERVAVLQGRRYSLWDAADGKISTSIPSSDPRYKNLDLRHVQFVSKEMISGIDHLRKFIVLLDPKSLKKVMQIRPKVIKQEKARKYGGSEVRAYAFSLDGERLYIGTNRKKIEIWKFTKGFMGFGKLEATFLRDLPLKHIPKVGAILPDPDNSERLYVAGENKWLIHLDITNNRVLKNYEADYNMQEPRGIQVSDDKKHVLVYGFGRVLVWKVDQKKQWDVLIGDGIKGATFRPGSDEIITIAKTIDVWKPLKRP